MRPRSAGFIGAILTASLREAFAFTLMRVAVVMVFVAARFSGKLFDGDNAAMEFGAVFVLELDGGVGDVEVLAEDVVEIHEDAVALGGRNVCDGDMAGQCAGL